MIYMSALGSQTTLYRMRVAHLRRLATMLDEAGHSTRLITPDSLPMLVVPRRNTGDANILATIGYGDVDWFRWRGGDYIAPVAEPEAAVEVVMVALRPRPVAGVVT